MLVENKRVASVKCSVEIVGDKNDGRRAVGIERRLFY
jgi:hypothetical protein